MSVQPIHRYVDLSFFAWLLNLPRPWRSLRSDGFVIGFVCTTRSRFTSLTNSNFERNVAVLAKITVYNLL